MSERVFDPRCLRFVATIRQGESARARQLVEACVAQKSPEWTYLNILVPSVFLVGELFVRGEIDGPASARLVEDIYPVMEVARRSLARREPLGLRAYATFMPGFSHNIGFLSIRHWLERDGWEVITRDPVPAEAELIEDILRAKPDMVAISCSLPRHVVGARRVIRALKASELTCPVWIGGMPINVIPGMFERTGADYTARDIVSFTREVAAAFGYETLTPRSMISPSDLTPKEAFVKD